MRLQSKADSAIITIRRSEYHENYRYWREHYTDVTPERTPKQDEQARLFRMLGDIKRFEQSCHRWNEILTETPFNDPAFRVDRSAIARTVYGVIEHKLRNLK